MAHLGTFLNQSCSVHKSTYEYAQIFRNTKKIKEKENNYGLDDPGFEFRHRQKHFLLFKTSRPALGPTQYANNWVPVFIPGVQRMGHAV